ASSSSSGRSAGLAMRGAPGTRSKSSTRLSPIAAASTPPTETGVRRIGSAGRLTPASHGPGTEVEAAPEPGLAAAAAEGNVRWPTTPATNAAQPAAQTNASQLPVRTPAKVATDAARHPSSTATIARTTSEGCVIAEGASRGPLDGAAAQHPVAVVE